MPKGDKAEGGKEKKGKEKKKGRYSTVDQYEHDPRHSAFMGNTERKCTDVSFLLLFMLWWLGMVVIAAVGFVSGEPERLLFAVSHNGVVCGTAGTVTDESTGETTKFDYSSKRRIYYPRLQEDLIAAYTGPDKALYDPSLGGNPTKIPFYGLCVDSCPLGGDVLKSDDGQKFDVGLNTSDVLYRCLPFYDVVHNTQIQCAKCQTGYEDECVNAPRIPCISVSALVTPSPCEIALRLENPHCIQATTYEEIETKKGARSDPIYDSMNSGLALLSRAMGDLQMAAFAILITGGLEAGAISFIWLFLLKHFAKLMVAGTIIAVYSMLLSITLYTSYHGGLLAKANDYVVSYLSSKGHDIDTTPLMDNINALGASVSAEVDVDEEKVSTYATIAYVLLVVDLVVICLLCYLRTRIRIAVGIIRQASHALAALPMLMLFPLVPCALTLLLMLYWVVVAGYVASAGQISTAGALSNVASTSGVGAYVDVSEAVQALNTTKTAKWEQNTGARAMLVYHLFGLLWSIEFINAFSVTVVAGAVSQYYWSAPPHSKAYADPGASTAAAGKQHVHDLHKKHLHNAVLHAVQRTLRYHMGSLAFGALIIATIKFLRICLEYIDQKTKHAQAANKALRVAMLALKCCLWCFEKCVKYISRNGYIIVAMRGYSFCPAILESFKLLFKNLAKIATVNIIAFFLLLLGKLAICACCILSMFLWINNPPPNGPTFAGDMTDLSSPLMPLLATAVLSYSVISYVFEIYSMSIDTILLSFCEDLEINKDSGDFFMSPELQLYINHKASKHSFKHESDTHDEDDDEDHGYTDSADGKDKDAAEEEGKKKGRNRAKTAPANIADNGNDKRTSL